MSRNGSGTYNLPAGNPVVTGTTISSTWANNTLNDMASALTGSLASDGQTTPSANLPMGTYAHTGVGNATVRTMYASAGQVQDSTAIYLTSVSGTNTILATGALGLSAYATGQMFNFVAAGANTGTGATTLNINSLGAKSVVRSDGSGLAAGDIVSGAVIQVVYDGTNFQIISDSTSKYANNMSISGNLNFTGTGNKIKGDFSNATLASRVAFQSSTTNGATYVGIIPNGTSVQSSVLLFGNSSTAANSPYTILAQIGGNTQLEAGRFGTGTYGNMELWSNGARQAYCSSSGGFYTTDGKINGYTPVQQGTGIGQLTNTVKIGWSGSQLLCTVDTTNQGAFTFTSDYRIKKDIKTQTLSGLDRVMKLRPVTFEFADYGTLYKADGVAREGFIAHEVKEVIPSGVDGEKDAENQIQSLRLDAIISVLTKAIQEQQEIITNLTTRVKELEAK